jgi:hypothetical protein
MSIAAQDSNGSPYDVGNSISVRCLVTAISSQGAGGLVSLIVETPGVLGQQSGVSFVVSPQQVRRMQGGIAQPPPTGITNLAGPFAGARDIESAPFNINDIVAVRALVTSIVGTGAGSVVTATVENAGVTGGISGISISVGPQQTRRAQGSIPEPLSGA